MRKSDNYPAWYKQRRYAHFDSPVSAKTAVEAVTDPQRVASHSFWPLLGFSQCERRRRKPEEGWKPKRRPIAYAAHIDSHIFAFYSSILGPRYEEALAASGLSDVVLAYRKHPGGKTNYDFAAESFAEIASRERCDVVALDIEGFFDNIPHRQLKKEWKALLSVDELPPDHYAVYKAATKFAVVPLKQVRKRIDLGVRAYRKLRRIPLTAHQFRTDIREGGLIKVNMSKRGIPQGLPISGLLANLVLLDVDTKMKSVMSQSGGLYRRYSDDILLVCPEGKGAELERILKQLLSALELRIQDKKTATCRFERAADGKLHTDKPLQYLGFDFDGNRVLIRPQTLVKFSKRMLRAVRRVGRAARNAVGPHGAVRLRRRDLFARYSHLRPHGETARARRPRGSFHSYAQRAGAALNKGALEKRFGSQIRRQVRRQWNRLIRLIEREEQLASSRRDGANG